MRHNRHSILTGKFLENNTTACKTGEETCLWVSDRKGLRIHEEWNRFRIAQERWEATVKLGFFCYIFNYDYRPTAINRSFITRLWNVLRPHFGQKNIALLSVVHRQTLKPAVAILQWSQSRAGGESTCKLQLATRVAATWLSSTAVSSWQRRVPIQGIVNARWKRS